MWVVNVLNLIFSSWIIRISSLCCFLYGQHVLFSRGHKLFTSLLQNNKCFLETDAVNSKHVEKVHIVFFLFWISWSRFLIINLLVFLGNNILYLDTDTTSFWSEVVSSEQHEIVWGACSLRRRSVSLGVLGKKNKHQIHVWKKKIPPLWKKWSRLNYYFQTKDAPTLNKHHKSCECSRCRRCRAGGVL